LIAKAKSKVILVRHGLSHLRITVKYAMAFRENAGVKEETYELDQASTTVAGVLDAIVHRHSSIGKLVENTSEEGQRRHMVVAVNSRLAKLSDEVHDGDNISLLLPVIGGSKKRREGRFAEDLAPLLRC